MSTPSADPGLTLPEFQLSKPTYEEFVYGVVFVWGFGDAVSTILAMAMTGSHAGEGNPWIRSLLASEPLLMLALKFAVALYVGVILLECRSMVEEVPGWWAWFVALLGAGAFVVVSNVYVGLDALIGL